MRSNNSNQKWLAPKPPEDYGEWSFMSMGGAAKPDNSSIGGEPIWELYNDAMQRERRTYTRERIRNFKWRLQHSKVLFDWHSAHRNLLGDWPLKDQSPPTEEQMSLDPLSNNFFEEYVSSTIPTYDQPSRTAQSQSSQFVAPSGGLPMVTNPVDSVPNMQIPQFDAFMGDFALDDNSFQLDNIPLAFNALEDPVLDPSGLSSLGVSNYSATNTASGPVPTDPTRFMSGPNLEIPDGSMMGCANDFYMQQSSTLPPNISQADHMRSDNYLAYNQPQTALAPSSTNPNVPGLMPDRRLPTGQCPNLNMAFPGTISQPQPTQHRQSTQQLQPTQRLQSTLLQQQTQTQQSTESQPSIRHQQSLAQQYSQQPVRRSHFTATQVEHTLNHGSAHVPRALSAVNKLNRKKKQYQSAKLVFGDTPPDSFTADSRIAHFGGMHELLPQDLLTPEAQFLRLPEPRQTYARRSGTYSSDNTFTGLQSSSDGLTARLSDPTGSRHHGGLSSLGADHRDSGEYENGVRRTSDAGTHGARESGDRGSRPSKDGSAATSPSSITSPSTAASSPSTALKVPASAEQTASRDTTGSEEAAGQDPAPAVRGRTQENLQCMNCKTRTTPLWRRDDFQNALCNACGLFYKLHGTNRPLKLKTDVIKRRNRQIEDMPLRRRRRRAPKCKLERTEPVKPLRISPKPSESPNAGPPSTS